MITYRDYVARSYLGISTSTPPMDEVAIGCPTTHNNSNAYHRATHGRAIYVGAIADPVGGSTHACSSSSSKLIIQASVICHHLQDTASPQMLQSG
jgi:hypothetical protein